jgi:hypothetical protein
MSGVQSSLAAVLLATLGVLGGGSAVAADPSPEEVLKDRGLTRTGSYYVLDLEAAFLKRLAEVQPLYEQLRGLFNKLVAVSQLEYAYAEVDERWNLLNERIGNVQAEIDAFPPLNNNVLRQQWRDLLELERQLRVQWNEANRERNLRWKALPPDGQKEKLSDEFREQREDFLKKTRDLRALADTINAKYDELSKDDAVKKALGSLRLSTKTRVELGPSPEFKKRGTQLKNAEKDFSPENFTRKGKARGAPGQGKTKDTPKARRDTPPTSGTARARPK